jgi:FeS assembly SUF system regulator
MLRISKMADYGTFIMASMVKPKSRLLSAQDIANQTHIALPSVSKLLKKLTKSGLLESVRGPSGGYRLKGDPATITVFDIITALEDKLALTECSDSGSQCVLQPVCTTKKSWRVINQAIVSALSAVTLADLAQEELGVTACQREQPLTFQPLDGVSCDKQ